jgi:hypothetical protein
MLAALAICAVGALSVGTASATEFKPANKGFTGKLATGAISVFVPSNDFNADGIGCSESGVVGAIPEEGALKKNQNKPGVGTHSVTYGSVITGITVTYAKCAIYNWPTGGPWTKVTPEIPVVVTPKTTNGTWTFAAFRNATSAPFTSIAVPKEAATIEYTVAGTTCKITVSPTQASSVFDEWTNGTATTASTDTVDGQIAFTNNGAATCEGESPAQLEATYSVVVNGTAEGPVIEK